MKRLLILLMVLPLMLVAQEYGLDEMIQHGLDNSWSAQQSKLSYESSASNLSSATWNLLPDADLGLRLNQDLHNQGPGADLTSAFNFSVSKTISLNDPAWFNYRQAKINKQKADVSYQTSVSAYAYEVFNAYIKVLRQQKQLLSLQENLAIQTRVWEQAKVLKQLGKNTDFDVKQSEIAVMNSQISIIQLENTIREDRQALFALVQMEDEGYELADLQPDEDYEIPALEPETTSEVQMLRAEIASAKLNKTQSTLDYFPRLTLGYGFSRNISGDNFEFDRYSTTHNVYLNLSYSLWNHFKQGNSATRSNIAYRMAELNLADKLDDLNRQYASQSQQLQYLLRMDKLLEEKKQQSAAQIRIAEERYRLGLIDLLELDKTRTDYIDADISYNANRYQIITLQQAINFLLSHKILGKW